MQSLIGAVDTSCTNVKIIFNTHGYDKSNCHCVKSYLKRKTRYPYIYLCTYIGWLSYNEVKLPFLGLRYKRFLLY